MSNDNSGPLLSLLGLARRAGMLAPGFDAAQEAMAAGRARAVLLACDVSSRTACKTEEAAARRGLPVCRLAVSMRQAGPAIGRKTAGVIAVNDSGFAEKLRALCVLNEEE